MTVLTIARRLVGHRFDTRFTWGEVSWHLKHPQIGLLYDPADTSEHNMLIVHAVIFSLYLYLPTWRHADGCMRGDEPSYGFYTMDRSIVFRWGEYKSKAGKKGYWSWDWPLFGFRHYSTEVLDLNRQRLSIEYSKPYRVGDAPPFADRYKTELALKAANSIECDYQYRLKSGTVQERQATVSIGRMVWRRKWLGPLFPMVRTSIDVQFSEEVGERSGSWKGGTIGCGYDMLPDESAIECLRRMERERQFT